MVVVSKPAWTALPDELVRMIMSLASREPHKSANYIRVAARLGIGQCTPTATLVGAEIFHCPKVAAYPIQEY